MAFSVVILVGFGTRLSFANGESLPGGRPGILRTIVEDATVYFLVIFSSHFVSLVMVFVARVSLNVFYGELDDWYQIVSAFASTPSLHVSLLSTYTNSHDLKLP